MMGHNPRAEIIDTPSLMPTVALRIDLWKQAWKRANELIIQAQSQWKKARDKKVEFKIGEKVWLEGRNLKSDRPSIKLAAKRYGPFKITKVLSPITYQLQLPLSWKIHDVFHVDLLTPYKETTIHGPNFIEPPPDLIDGEEEYEVEAILDSRRSGRGHKLQYLIKWKGYSDTENQWVDAKDIHADQLLAQFKKRLARSINTEPVHCRRIITSMSSHGSSMHSPNLFAVSLPTQDNVSQGKAKALAIAEAFKSWRPQVPSSWRTPSESENTSSSDEFHSDNGSPVLRRCFSMPQQLIPTQGSYQSLYAGRMPGEHLWPLIPTDNKPDQLCAPQHCPLPDSPLSTQSSFPAPSPVVLSDTHVDLINSTLAEALHPSSRMLLKSEIRSITNTPCPLTSSPSDHVLRKSTLLGHYQRTKGGCVKDPLYSTSTSPRTTKKLLRFWISPEARRMWDEMALQMMPCPGRMLTRHLAGTIMDSIDPLQALS